MGFQSATGPEVIFESCHGRRRLAYPCSSLTVRDVLSLHRVPSGSVSIYARAEGGMSGLLAPLQQRIDQLGKICSEIVVRPDRNIDYSALVNRKAVSRRGPSPVAEYTFPSDDSAQLVHVGFSAQECKDYVSESVVDFLSKRVDVEKGRKIVLGISGGGDSNTLIESFLSSNQVTPEQLVAVMVLGVPDWDMGRDRAQSICDQHGVELRFVAAEEVNQLLGRRVDSDWVEDFEQFYPDTDMEVIGTLAVRLALVDVAKDVGAQGVVVGLNLEDMLAESLLRTMQGQLPLPFPVRPIDEVPFWFPLYRVPKRILDGCHPKFSLQNYLDRYPSKMIGRAIPYYLAQMLHDILPGSEFDMLGGFEKLAEVGNLQTAEDKRLGMEVWDDIPQEVQNKWLLFKQA